MLSELRIRNLAVVEDAVIPFGGGLNVLTGSTGAGKSIILTAVELLSGSRARRSLLRSGAGSLTVEGVFEVPADWPLRECLGMGSSDDCLSIKRELAAGGKSRIWINGMLSTNNAAREAVRSLLELHGQHRQQELLDQSNHILYLDAWGDYKDVLGKCMEMIERYRNLYGRMGDLLEKSKRHREEEDFLRFQLSELEGLNLEPDLDRKIERRIKLMENIHRYISGLEESRALLNEEDGSVLEKLGRAEKLMGSFLPLDESWEQAASELREARLSVQEIIREVSRALGEIQTEPEDLERLQDKLAAVQRAGRKHGLDCNGLIERMDELKNILRSLTDGSDEVISVRKEFEEVKGRLVPLLEELTSLREESASILDREVTNELDKLGMKGALFRTKIEKLGNSAFQDIEGDINLSMRGSDRVEFGIRTNIGEEVHPLSEVVSGGELSRITLVLKKLQVEEKGIPTLIFDEIDSGLGADLGGVVAERLRDLARRYQIICITHIPQVAALASKHIVVRKKVRDGRTATTASVVSGETRIAEIARMLGGKGKLREELAVELLGGVKSARSSVG